MRLMDNCSLTELLSQNGGKNYGDGGTGDQGKGELHDPLSGFLIVIKLIVKLFVVSRELIQLVCQIFQGWLVVRGCSHESLGRLTTRLFPL
jgi:hypothetical protein